MSQKYTITIIILLFFLRYTKVLELSDKVISVIKYKFLHLLYMTKINFHEVSINYQRIGIIIIIIIIKKNVNHQE